MKALARDREVAEGDTEAEILMYLRHEMGHALNYAYRLYATEEWNDLFGSYARPYLDSYQVRPFSRDYVRHVPGWYAQKHPDEDFAETFAVWMTPGSDWKTRYEGAGALKKLLYVDRVARELGDKDPPIPPIDVPDAEPVEVLGFTVGEHIERIREPGVDVPPFFDGDLRDLFQSQPSPPFTEPAEDFLRRHRRLIVKRLAHWTGVREGVVRSLLDHLAERAKALKLFADRRRRNPMLVDLMAYATTLSMNHVYMGNFIPGVQKPDVAGKDGRAAAGPLPPPPPKVEPSDPPLTEQKGEPQT